MTEADQITVAVAQARGRLPNLPDDDGSRAIAAGMTAAQVEGDLGAMMSENPCERGKVLMADLMRRQGMTPRT